MTASVTLPATRPTALTRATVTAGLLALSGGAWVVTGDRMAGMDAAPGADLGAPGWFAVTWVVMTTAMMLPSLVPAALLAGRAAATFSAAYVAAWTAAGVAAYVAFEAVRGLDVGFLAWDRAGRHVAAGAILAAAAYQLTPAKAACLEHCRTPKLAPGGGLGAGLRHGASCIGCCGGLMATLFALGAMSVTWMVAVAVLIAAERLLPCRTPALYGVAAAVAVLAVWLAVAPGDLPGLTQPGAMAGM